eukprot:gb/GFBE01027771.1/.p1 GENE.gb/GFBE01027771.1/~~gb/GFBE01027771.1/.p1  ORF type:complete len:690 (+),score=127.26 gb/GFBE01027771.1/:1-2070(+)
MKRAARACRCGACQALLLILPAFSLGQTISDVLSSTGDFTVLLEAVQKAGLADTLTGPGPVTVFAPTDAAFATLLSVLGSSKEEVLESEDLAAILQLHVAAGQIDSSTLAGGAIVQSLEGARLQATLDESTGQVAMGSAKVAQPGLNGSNGVVHGIDAVLLPPERLALAGGAKGWDQSSWYVQVDGVMGGKSTGQATFAADLMTFTGTINLDGGGFSSVRKTIAGSLDLSSYAGLLVEFNSQPSAGAGAPLGLHLQLGDKSSYGYAAAWAVPLSAERERCKVFLPLENFDRASRGGYVSNSAKLNTASIDQLDIYMLFQSGPFEIQLHSVSAVRNVLDAPLPTAPSVPMTPSAVSTLVANTIAKGGALYDKGYQELCIAIYAAAARQILAATGLGAIRGIACAGLTRAATGSNAEQAWVLRMAFDAIAADVLGNPRESASRYPAEVRGSWLPGAGEAEAPGSCAGLADLSSSLVDSTTGINIAATTRQPSIAGTANDNTFLGPFVGMGISGYNDLGQFSVRSPDECKELCLKNAQCKSFDHGARGSVSGECWLSTANRASAPSSYTAWELYDYYERSDAPVNMDRAALGGAVSINEFNMGSPAADDEAKGYQDEDGGSDITMFIVLGAVLLLGGAGLGVASMLLLTRCRGSKRSSDQQVPQYPAAAVSGVPSNPTVVVVGQPVTSKYVA